MVPSPGGENAPTESPGADAGARLVLGPLLRHTGAGHATIWVETDAACSVEILGAATPTFCVEGHHYGLVTVEGLPPGTTRYDVRLDGRIAWPLKAAGSGGDPPAPAIRMATAGEGQARIVFGSCRIGGPETLPEAGAWPEELRQSGIDALRCLSRSLQRGAPPPDLLLLIGDQVYADEVSEETIAFIHGRRDTREPPGEQIADFEEYTRLYRESWSDPDIRWLLSSVPSAMIFDDHDVHDDWNISASWVEEMRRRSWWESRIIGALMSYWLYQHLGNLSPEELRTDPLLARVRAAADGGPELRAAAHAWDRDAAASRWAFHRDIGASRVLVLDSRAARVLEEGRRQMIDPDEWAWIHERSRPDAGPLPFDHLVVVSTLPVFLPAGIHHLQAWNAALCAGRYGRLVAALSEKLRRGVDLEHWAAFSDSFEQLCDWLRELTSSGAPGEAPASVLILGGDVHNTYSAEVDLRVETPSRVLQIVCSPFRNRLTGRERALVRATGSRLAAAVFGRLARAAGVAPPSVGWRLLDRPSFENALAEIELDGRMARLSFYRSPLEGETGSGSAGELDLVLLGRRVAAG